MRRHTSRPSEFRCLLGVAVAVLLFVLLAAIERVFETLCSATKSTTCQGAPDVMVYGLLSAAALCLVWSVYRAYRDFIVGEYYFDLAEAGYL